MPRFARCKIIIHENSSNRDYVAKNIDICSLYKQYIACLRQSGYRSHFIIVPPHDRKIMTPLSTGETQFVSPINEAIDKRVSKPDQMYIHEFVQINVPGSSDVYRHFEIAVSSREHV